MIVSPWVCQMAIYMHPLSYIVPSGVNFSNPMAPSSSSSWLAPIYHK